MPLKLTGATTGSLTIDAKANGGDVVFSGDIGDLTGVDFTTSASSGDLLSYNGTNWVPSTTPHTLTLAGLTGDVDLTTSVPVNGDYLYYDGGSSKWVKKDLMTAVVALDTAQTLSSLAGVDLTTLAPSINDHLSFDGTNWVPVAPSGGGGSTTLNSMTDTNMVGLTTGYHLSFNGTEWVPTNPTLNSMTDTNMVGLTTGYHLSFDGTEWVPTNPTLNSMTDTSMAGLTTGDVLSFNGTNWVPVSAGTPSSIAGTMTGHVIPDTDDVYDIGSATYKVRDLYLGSNSLHLGSVDITESSGKLVLPYTEMAGHMIPDTNDTYDIGSAEYKIRDMYVSDNSLWVGDDHKVSVEGGKMKFRKRKGTKQIPPVIDALVLAANPLTNSQERIAIVIAAIDPLFPSHTITQLSHIKLRMWVTYLKTFAGHENDTIQDVFRNQDDDYEEDEIISGKQEILVKQSGTLFRQKYMNANGLQNYSYLDVTHYDRGAVEEAAIPNDDDWFVTTIPSGIWGVHYTKKECVNYVFQENEGHLKTVYTRVIDPAGAGYDAVYPNHGTYGGSWMDETSCEVDKHTWDGSTCSIDLSLAPEMLASMDEAKCVALSVRKWDDIFLGHLAEVPNTQALDIHYSDVVHPATNADPILDDMVSGNNKPSHGITLYDIKLNVPAQAEGIWVNSHGGKEPLLKRKVSKTASATQHDIENINTTINKPMHNKNIWWIGTSIPATAGYVGKVEDILGAKVANVAVGASRLSRGRSLPMSVHIAGTDDHDTIHTDSVDYIKDIPYVGHVRSVLYSGTEKAAMWDNWDTYWDNLVYDVRRAAPWAPECIVNGTLDASIKREKVCADTTGGVWTQVTKCTDGTSGDLATCEAQDFIKTSDSSVSGKHKWLVGYSTNQWAADLRSSMKTSYSYCLDPYLDKTTMGNDLPDVFVIDHGFNDRSISATDGEWARYDPNDPMATNRNTFRGSVNWLINHIRASLPRAEIVMISHHNKALPKELSLVTLQKQIAEDRCIPFLDLSSKTGLTLHKVPNTAHLWDAEPWKGLKPNNSETGTCSNTGITNQNDCEVSNTWTYKDMSELRLNIPDLVHPHRDRTWHTQNKIAHHCAEFINENTIVGRLSN